MSITRIRALQKLGALDGSHFSYKSKQTPSSWAVRTPATSTLPWGRRSFRSTTVNANQASGDESKNQSTDNQIPPLSPSDNNLLLKSQFEIHGDIREYLRRWQETNPPILDPLMRATNDQSVQDSGQIVGNMPNGREARELWGDPNRPQQESLHTEEYEGEFLEPGDLVARLNADGIFNYAIYVRSVHKQKQFYSSSGNWRICSNMELDYVIKDFAPVELIEPLKPWFPDTEAIANEDLQLAPEGGLPRSVGGQLLEMMNNFKTHTLAFYRENSQVLDDLHSQVADETEILHLTLEQLTMNVLGIEEDELTSVNIFAVHQAVRRFPFLVEKESSSVFSRMYIVQPKRIANIVKQVVDWTHEHQDHCVQSVLAKSTQKQMSGHPMQQFLSKAQRLIRLSRKVRSPTVMSSVGPSSQRFPANKDGNPMVYREMPTEQFNANDQMIIEYLQLYAVPTIIMPSGTLRSTATHIMRATGMYNAIGLSEASTRLLLQELGVIAPWENLFPLDQYLMLPGHGVSLAKDLEAEEVMQSCQNISAERLQDSMQDLRKDWGDMPVYCVDDVTAQEIDDGISLEKIPGSSNEFWVHVHVANPTAFLKHDDPIIEYASTRLSTSYLPERTYPMLPNTLTEPNFSLAAGRPVLTFSAKMNLQGELLDSKIQNGTIHNVINMTHKTLRGVFNSESDATSNPLIVGGEYTSPQQPEGKIIQESLRPEELENFHTMRQLMLAFREIRKGNGAMDSTPLRPNLAISVQAGSEGMKPYEMQASQGRYYLGDPVIRLSLNEKFDPYEVRDQSKDNLISLVMNLAGHVSGQFCAARNIPAIFDGTWYDPEYGRLTNKNLNQFGGEGFFQMVAPLARSSTSPIYHHFLGLPAYVKSTSPLRRYTDIVAHYQIETALRFEHEHGRQFNALTDSPDPAADLADADGVSPNDSPSTPTSLLPFSKSTLDAYISNTQPLRTHLRWLDTFSSQHWACMLLFRAFYFNECALPDTFPCVLRTPRQRPKQFDPEYSAVIANMGLNCAVTIPEDFADKDKLDIFCLVDARITAVDMATFQVTLEATRFVKPFERTGEWA
ncbi:hypothetical protein N7541_011998 [Penicillium brevicompactum]|uniref:RNB domain-containing protein n=1 Tax=Penicillium brevicompactum TaxID=5074 RepID=A0A9W9UGA6_PENBR|nr:hypothetical protein N7452_006766 [Penicillium brevicompactum]KAJ5342874.1 hypothetical protein N7541_011998 [Penicillium brevicompactum]